MRHRHLDDDLIEKGISGHEVECSVWYCTHNDSPACTIHKPGEPIQLVPNGEDGARCLKFDKKGGVK